MPGADIAAAVSGNAGGFAGVQADGPAFASGNEDLLGTGPTPTAEKAPAKPEARSTAESPDHESEAAAEAEPGQEPKPAEEAEAQGADKEYDYFGRPMKGDELLKTALLSGRESVKNYREKQELSRQLSELQAHVIELEEQLDTTSGFEEKTEDELNEMTPAAVAKYYADKGEYDKTRKGRVEARKAAKDGIEGERAKTRDAINAKIADMENNTAKYPLYHDVEPIILELADRYPFAKGRPDSCDLFYLASVGLFHTRIGQARSKGKTAADEATRRAAENETAALQTGRTGAKTQGKPKPGSDEEFNQGLINAGAKSVF